MSKSSYLTKVVDSTFENDFDDKCKFAQQRNVQKQIMHDIELGCPISVISPPYVSYIK